LAAIGKAGISNSLSIHCRVPDSQTGSRGLRGNERSCRIRFRLRAEGFLRAVQCGAEDACRNLVDSS
jgi:hypothetical protein